MNRMNSWNAGVRVPYAERRSDASAMPGPLNPGTKDRGGRRGARKALTPFAPISALQVTSVFRPVGRPPLEEFCLAPLRSLLSKLDGRVTINAWIFDISNVDRLINVVGKDTKFR